MSEIDDLNTAVSNLTTVVNSAITELQTLAAMEAAATSLTTLATILKAAIPAS